MTTLPIPPESTILQAKEAMRKEMYKGCICPACAQPVKVYARSITSSMAYGLITLYRFIKSSEKEYFCVHIENVLKGMNVPASIRGDLPKLRFWNLLEPMRTGKDDENPNSGIYKITEAGTNFILGKTQVMSHVWLYNNKSFGYPPDAKPITIQEALKNKFNYKELMGL